MTIKILGESVLSEPCNTVTNVDDVKDIITELWETVESVKGAGLSANQLGYNVAVAVINNIDDGERFVIINPEVIEGYGDKCDLHEGCLSIPGVAGNVKRYLSIKLKYMAEDGNVYEDYFVGRNAHIIQHEVEHLNGMLYIDNYGKIRRDSMIKKHMRAIKKSK